MAHDRVQHVAVVQRVAETGDLGPARHVVGLPVVSHKVLLLTHQSAPRLESPCFSCPPKRCLNLYARAYV